MRMIETTDAEGVLNDIVSQIDTGKAVKINGSTKKVYIVSEKEYKDLQKAKNNAEYLNDINEALQQIKEGKVIYTTVDELKAMTE